MDPLRRSHRDQRGPPHAAAHGPQHRRPTDPGRFAFHFFEVNPALDFERPATLGMRLDVPSGQSIRFEPGDERDVGLVEYGGSGRVIGFNNLVDGSVQRKRS